MADGNGMPPLPDGDPFTMLTDIDARLGRQAPIWTCNPDGTPNPMPTPLVRGLNTFVSVFSFSIDPGVNALDYMVTAGGAVSACDAWNVVGTPMPPICPPEPCGPIPECSDGIVVYSPQPTEPRAFECSLYVRAQIPGPGSLAGVAVGAGLARWGRRRTMRKT
ncbi:MAG: hypothetical protein AB7G11_00610 [Phycisphaerales bacterium]